MFFQEGPRLTHPFDTDRPLRSYLERVLPRNVFSDIEPGLRALGDRVLGEVEELGRAAEREEPVLVPYDPWGRRVDEIRVGSAWRALDRMSAEEKLVATAYERKHGEWSRVHQFARVYLWGPSSAIYTCPLAMTDGAARAIELYGDAGLKGRAFKHLTSSRPEEFWTSGQWMTERTGGSDVGGTSTIARMEGGEYRLYGTKWFTSATTSQMAMTLARIEGAPEGSRGLSMFYLELRRPDGSLNGIEVHRLKDKLGTKALPTAELTLQGARAQLVGGPGDGVRKIASLFNITRVWNAACAVGFMGRGLALARDYSGRRSAFGKLLREHPLHVETLATMTAEFHGAFLMMMRTAELLGREETGKASEDESAVLRLMTPLLKLSTAKQGVAIASEVLESFGGAGYVEDTGLPKLLRDSQVLAIWEGTTNVLALDGLRAIEKEQALEPFLKDLEARAARVKSGELRPLAQSVTAAAAAIRAFEPSQASARGYAMALARAMGASLLLEQADWELATGKGRQALLAARRWCERSMTPSTVAPEKDASELVFGR